LQLLHHIFCFTQPRLLVLEFLLQLLLGDTNQFYDFGSFALFVASAAVPMLFLLLLVFLPYFFWHIRICGS
jgi:hypothetical protein